LQSLYTEGKPHDRRSFETYLDNIAIAVLSNPSEFVVEEKEGMKWRSLE
jgi:hypothetical protein